MTLRLNPDILRAAYDYLSECRPFSQWNLPDSSDVVFKVIRDKNIYASYLYDDDHTISVSSSTVGHTLTLMKTMAHEMLHMHQELRGLDTSHGPAFRKWAAQVCRVHGFDPQEF